MKVYGSAGTWAASNLADDRIVCSPGTTLNNDTDIDAGWDMEIRIPYALLGVSSISSGKIVGFTFVINDDDLVNYNWDYHGYPWTSVTDIYVPYTWGILQFQ